MALRWCTVGMAEAAMQFRKVNSFLHLPASKKGLDDHVRRAETPADYSKEDAA